MLPDNPSAVVHLAGMMIKRGRNDIARAVYRDGLELYGHDPLLTFHAGVHLMRHYGRAEVEEFYRSAPSGLLEDTARRCYAGFPGLVARLVSVIEPGSTVVSVAVWGREYMARFIDGLLASLLEPGNLPSVPATVVVFTTGLDAAMLKKSRVYADVCRHARVHFEYFDVSDLAAMRLADPDVAKTLKFLLVSGAHRAAVEACRQRDAVMFWFGGDNVVNDGYMSTARSIMADAAVNVAAVPGIRVYGGGTDTPQIPDEFFIDSEKFAEFPLLIAWRSGDGIVVRANHMMPGAIRCGALNGPVDMSIDPLDGRFLMTALDDIDSIRMVSGPEMTLIDVSDDPLIENKFPGPFDVERVARWLLCYDDPLRRKYFRHAVRYGCDGDVGAETVEEIFAAVDRLKADV